MTGAIAQAGVETPVEHSGDPQNTGAPRARGGHGVSSAPARPRNATRPHNATRPRNATPPRNGESAGVRERMLRATLELIAQGGVGAVTNRRVARAAGVSLGSLTYHFASQAQLLRESLLLHVEEETTRRERIAGELAGGKPSVRDVAEAVERLVAVPAEIPRQIAELELHLQAARDPELREASRRCFHAHEQIARAALGALGIADPERHAPAVVALMTGLAVRRLAAGGQDAKGTSEALLALVHGLEPS